MSRVHRLLLAAGLCVVLSTSDIYAAGTRTLLESHFNAGSDGFVYADDTFNGTSAPTFATGAYAGGGGATGGGLQVFLGPGPVPSSATSGGWSKTFTVAPGGATITLSISYRLIFASEYETDEFGEALVTIGGTRLGSDTNTSLIHTAGNGNGGSAMDSGWVTEQFDLGLGQGAHTILVGGYNNKSTFNDEMTDVRFDDIVVTAPNKPPTDPTALSLSECPAGGGTDKTPELSFTLADPDGDDLTYRVQIDDTSNAFGSLVVDYESAAEAPGGASFIVGQAAGAGSYAVGSAGQELSTGTHYWRVRSNDGDDNSNWVVGGSFTVVHRTVDFSAGTYSGAENAGAITVTVQLSGASCELITVDYTSGDGTADAPDDYAAVSGTLTFSPGQTSKTFTVTPVDDDFNESDETVTLTLSSPSQATLAAVNNPATLTIQDNDIAGISVTQTGGSTDVTEGDASDSYSVQLTSRPTPTVIVTIDPDAQTDLGSGPGVAVTRTFTSGNWNTPQTVTVTAVDDAVIEGAHTSTIVHTAASGDPEYDGIAIDDVIANITDNDSASITLAESGGSTHATEGGTTDTYTIVLDAQPTANVTITVDPDAQTDLGSGGGNAVTLTFTSVNWATAQTVNVTATNDAVDEDVHTSTITHAVASADGNYDGIAIGNVTVTITDNDTAGITVTQSGGSTTATEGGAGDSYTIVLDSEPRANVTVTVDPDDQSDLGSGAGTAPTLTFTSGNWSTPKTIVVSAVDDAIDEGPHVSIIVHSVASGDGDYAGMAVGNISVAITDDDVAGVTITESGGTAVTEGGASDTYTVVLDSQPTNDVVVTVDPDNQTDLGAGPGTAIALTFTGATWSASQAVTVTALDDAVAEGAHASTIVHTVASLDGNYNAMDLSGDDVTVTVTDNDNASVTITESGGSSNLIETGVTDSYTIVLGSEPTADVTITIDPDDQADVGAARDVAVQRVFTAANWATPQVIVITPFNDSIDEGGHTSTVTHTATSADGGYNGIAIASVVANIADDDIAGIGVVESGGSTACVEGGATDTYTIVLDTQPSNDVEITITPTAEADVGGGSGVPTVLTFTDANWATAQTVTVTASNDDVDEDAHFATLSHVSTSADGNYDDRPISDVIVAITDNDTAGVTITESGGSTAATEGGATDTYTVVLDTKPTANVIVSIDPDTQSDLGSGPGTAIQFTFTAANWSVAQTVTVTATNDDYDEGGGHTSSITHTVSSTDGKYNGLDLSGDTVVVAITDNDIAGVTIVQSDGSTEVGEDGSIDSYTMALDSRPTANVTVTIDPDGQGSVGAGADAAITITFTPGNWSVARSVTVAAINDLIDEDAHSCTIAHSVASGDANYDGIAVADVVASISDNDTASVAMIPTDGSTDITEDGTTDIYTLGLGTEPTANVTITVDPDIQSDIGAGNGAAITLTFTPANWDTAQTITVTAVDDAIAEGPHTSTITHTASSADSKYNGLAVPNAVPNIGDNDSAAIVITHSGGTTELTEGGSSDTYAVVLTSEPVANVSITAAPDVALDLGSGAGAAIVLVFTNANWDTAQTVTVDAVDDFVDAGLRNVLISHTAASGDGSYNGASIANVIVALTDNDFAGVTRTETDGSTAPVEGGADTYTLVLDSEPTASVTITIAGSPRIDLGDGLGAATTRTFTAANWSTPQTVTVTLVDDAVSQGPMTTVLPHSVASADSCYHALVMADLAVFLQDNEDPGGPPSWPPDVPDPNIPSDPNDTPDPNDASPPGLTIDIALPDATVLVGDELMYVVTLANPLAVTVSGVDVAVTLSGGATHIATTLVHAGQASAIDPRVAADGSLLFAIGDVAGNDSLELMLVVRVDYAGHVGLSVIATCAQAVVGEGVAALTAEDSYEVIVVTRTTDAMCGAISALNLAILCTALLAAARIRRRAAMEQ